MDNYTRVPMYKYIYIYILNNVLLKTLYFIAFAVSVQQTDEKAILCLRSLSVICLVLILELKRHIFSN